MIQKIIEDWIENNHVPTVNIEGYLMVNREDLTKLLVKYKSEQLLINGVVVPKGTLVCECGEKPKDVPNDGYDYMCNKCRKPFAN